MSIVLPHKPSNNSAMLNTVYTIVPEWLVTRVHVEKSPEDEKELTPTMVS